MVDRAESIASMCRLVTADLPVEGAAVGLMGSDRVRETVYASDEAIAQVELRQFSLGEGPVLTAFTRSRPILVPDVRAPAAAAWWPVFTAEIATLPVRGLFAFPMQLGAVTIGVCEVYRAQAGSLEPAQLSAILRAVDLLSVSLLALNAGASPDLLDATWLDGRDPGRRAVHQATGMLVAQLGVPAEQAFSRLRAHAYLDARGVEEVAADIVARRVRLEPDPDPQPP